MTILAGYFDKIINFKINLIANLPISYIPSLHGGIPRFAEKHNATRLIIISKFK